MTTLNTSNTSKQPALKKATLISAGNFLVSIGTYKLTEIAIISKSTGEFVQQKQIKVSKKLKSAKRKFKANLNSNSTFTFSHMQPAQVYDLINLLKK